MLYTVTARVILIGLNYTQPFLISRLIDYVGDKSPNKNDGYGLMGAFALVVILKGVRDCVPLVTFFFRVNMKLTKSFAGFQWKL